jgi:hypothetical protein
MPSTKEKIELIATEILFTDFSISYKVRINSAKEVSGVVFCHENIKDKDLILNPTFIDKNNNIVIFVVTNVTPHFYSDILDRTIRGFDEYKSELDKIYAIGEVVGFILF